MVVASEANTGPTETTLVIDRVVTLPVKKFWGRLVARAGGEALLGEGGEIGDKGDSWAAKDGTHGVIRSYHPLEQIRFTWYAAEGAPKTMVAVNLTSLGDRTQVEIVHSGVPYYFDQAALGQRWNTALDRLVDVAG